METYLKGVGYEPFLPRLYKECADASGERRRVLAPAIHNLLFLPKEGDGKAQARTILECPYPVRILREPGAGRYYEIPDRQMVEFRMVCDPRFANTIYTTRAFADERKGKLVRVKQGLFKGLVGKMVRYKNHHYIVITLIHWAVFLRISRWYCEPID